MTKSVISKTCIACGLEKPIAAFLQMTGSQGTMYGNVCSACRGANAKANEVIELTEDEHGSTSSGLRIDADARNQAEILEKKVKIDKEESALDESKKRDKLAADKTERFDSKYAAEKDHRQNYIEAKKKQGFLRFQENKTETISAQRKQEIHSLIERHQQTLETQKTEAAKEEHRLTSTDLSTSTLGIRTDEIRHQGTFLAFVKWLGGSAPITQAAEQAFNKKVAETAKNKKTPVKDPALKDDAPTESAKNSWPSRRR